MSCRAAFSIALSLLLISCGTSSDEREYRLQGQVLAVAANRQEATIKHEEIQGLMPAMTMPYKVKEPKLLEGIAAGDLVNARLVIVSNDAYLTALQKVGEAPLDAAPPAPAAASGFELLKPGEPVPQTTFLDQDGRRRDWSAFKGSTVALTFIYTRCPMPTFCPLMDRHFAAIQKTLKADPARTPPVHLVSVSFDPITDTPPVLKAHAKSLGADPAMWTFLTGKRDEVDQFAMRFGVSLTRAMNDQLDISHNLRTALIDADGKLVKIYTGNEWTPEQLLADVKSVGRAN